MDSAIFHKEHNNDFSDLGKEQNLGIFLPLEAMEFFEKNPHLRLRL